MERAQSEGECIAITARDKRVSNEHRGMQGAEVEMTEEADAEDPPGHSDLDLGREVKFNYPHVLVSDPTIFS